MGLCGCGMYRHNKKFVRLKGNAGQVTSVDFNPDGSHIISGSRDRTLKLWEADTGEHLGTFEGHTDVVWSVAFSPDGSLIVSGSERRHSSPLGCLGWVTTP